MTFIHNYCFSYCLVYLGRMRQSLGLYREKKHIRNNTVSFYREIHMYIFFNFYLGRHFLAQVGQSTSKAWVESRQDLYILKENNN